MSSKLNRWLRSKSGMATIAGVLVVALVFAIVGVQQGWWGGGATAGEFPLPVGGYTCLPTCETNDGRMLVFASTKTSSFSEPMNFWIGVPAQAPNVEVGIFDGDSGKDPTGAIYWPNGNWDYGTDELIYTLYADALKDGQGTKVLGTWRGNQDAMPNNDWFNITLPQDPDAMAPSGHYFYRLRIEAAAAPIGYATFKLRSNGYLSNGTAPNDTPIGVMATVATVADRLILFPQFAGYANPGPSIYDGDWKFFFYLPEGTTSLEIWNGDFDRGGIETILDTDDPNTTGKPAWAASSSVVYDEGVINNGLGMPPDDSPFAMARRSPSVFYELINPSGNPIYTDTDASGTEEWERYSIGADPNAMPDMAIVDTTTELPAGYYIYHIAGLDVSNAIWIKLPICTVQGCGPDIIPPPPPPATPSPVPQPTPDVCVPDAYNKAGKYAIVALNPEACRGQQNGLLFHGTSLTELGDGKAFSNGCLRGDGVPVVNSGGVDYIQPQTKGNFTNFNPQPTNVTTPLVPVIAPPDCSNPAAHQMDGKDFKGNITLESGLWCITGDVSINAQDTVIGQNVTLVFLDGRLKINGGATVQLSAPNPIFNPAEDNRPAMSGVVIYVPEENASGIEIAGNQNSYYEGIIYGPNSDISFLGTSSTIANRTQIIGWNVEIGGTADVIIDYDGSELPSCPVP